MDRPGFHVAIIGAGLSGLALALALHQQSIACTIYEASNEPRNVGGALMLLPNGLNVLKKLDLYESVCQRGFRFDDVYLQDGTSGKIIEQFEYGSQERYDTSALRIYRRLFLHELLSRVEEKSIPIRYHHRFTQVVAESKDEVTFEFTNGSRVTASMLVGADGIHSIVRSYVAPGVQPHFVSQAAIIAAIPTDQLQLPVKERQDICNASNTHPFPIGIVMPQMGAFVIAPQSPSGDEVMITVQRRIELDELDRDKDALRALLRQNAEHYPSIVRHAVSEIPAAGLNIWPFYQVPYLPHWTSMSVPSEHANGQANDYEDGNETGDGSSHGYGRVLILGDAAHALPPATGQGANQALQDVYILAQILGAHDPAKNRLRPALREWQASRQVCVNDVLDLNRQMDQRRLPSQPGAVSQSSAEARAEMKTGFEKVLGADLDAAVAQCLQKLYE